MGYTLTMLTGDRILLREDVVVGTICAAVATLGAPPLPRAWRLVAGLVLAGDHRQLAASHRLDRRAGR